MNVPDNLQADACQCSQRQAWHSYPKDQSNSPPRPVAGVRAVEPKETTLGCNQPDALAVRLDTIVLVDQAVVLAANTVAADIVGEAGLVAAAAQVVMI